MDAKAWTDLGAAAIGFAGVIVTLVWNAQATRNEARRRRAQDAASLRMALTAELEELQTALAGHIHWAQRPESPDVWVPIVDYFSVLKANTQNLGLLSPDEVSVLVRAHTTYQREMGNMMRLASRDVVANPIIGANLLRDFADVEHREHALTILHDIQGPVCEALSRMSLQTKR